ncbi:MAG: hypothetical protein C4K60_00615 [Ideonella sp. MAG2]|nr:MAG: hypothetical protein C4K60_00615 [Ideonella sp. MAG2]
MGIVSPQIFTNTQTAFAFKTDIQHHSARRLHGQFSIERGRAADIGDRVVVLFEHKAQGGPHDVVIFHQEDRHGAGVGVGSAHKWRWVVEWI